MHSLIEIIIQNKNANLKTFNYLKTKFQIILDPSHTNTCIRTYLNLMLCQTTCVVLQKIPKCNLWPLMPVTQNMTFWNSNAQWCCLKVGEEKKKSPIIIMSISYLLRNHILKMNTRHKYERVLKACRQCSEIPCCQISPDQEAEAALLMLLKRILKWQRGVQAMTLILRADCQIISSSAWCLQLLHNDSQDEESS